MSAYTTLRITRSTALALALEYLLRAPDEAIARLMDSMLEERLYNCTVVPDGSENDDAEARG